MAPQAKATKAKIRKWDFIRVKSFSTIKEDTNNMKTQPMKWEKRYANHVSFKELISKIYKEFIQLHSKKKGEDAEVLNILPVKTQVANRCMNRYSTSPSTRETQIKTSRSYHFTPAKSGHYQKHRKHMLVRMWRKRNPGALLVGM